ncbi:hypothetical protein PACTADRAFT_39488 [Pachysolen tannophilus NRRL Y-2460]|uniref:FAD dependent oxidoreductase domain-containing protein n=1 Tax=Pachysolen tannophilus NRRL Y-2460 TaxID=669874 RepID=A0A1E4TXQ3_PACTA|nr:hypothetical protein PACTADRAFT_39488 [Pachysolen tannophilus NRRL Y-2460]
MTSNPIKKDSPIIVVGAGVFGLSNALHLAQNGYTNITVFDRLDFDSNNYTLLKGADTASADINKIFRIQYADKIHYQRLAMEAGEIWEKWDRDIKLLPEEEAKKYTALTILDRCGMLRLDDIEGNSKEENQNLASFEKDGLRSLQFDANNPADVKRANATAKASGWGNKINPLKLKERGKVENLSGILYSTSGILYASRACQYAKYLCVQLGVKFILGGNKGTFQDFITSEKDRNEILGVVCKDGTKHFADLTVIACGPWSTSLVPELDGINEGTTGSVVIFKIPDGRKDLYEKYSPRNFPIISWKGGHSREKEYLGGLYLFPAMEPEGVMKMIIRQKKYTNPVKLENNRIVSIPKTVNSNPPTTKVTKHILDQAKSFLTVIAPDLVEAGIKLESRIIWYTDTINNDYIYDFVPGKKNLFVSCGGSGHAFKMLPVLGKFLVDKIERRENFYTNLFKWRNPKDFTKDPNGLKEGITGPRVYDKQSLPSDDDYKFQDIEKKVKNLKLYQ